MGLTTSMLFCSVLSIILVLGLSLDGTMFKRTRNISTTSWSSALQLSSMTSTLLDCAGLCVFTDNGDGSCNAFKYDKMLKDCQLAQVWMTITIFQKISLFLLLANILGRSCTRRDQWEYPRLHVCCWRSDAALSWGWALLPEREHEPVCRGRGRLQQWLGVCWTVRVWQ